MKIKDFTSVANYIDAVPKRRKKDLQADLNELKGRNAFTVAMRKAVEMELRRRKKTNTRCG